MSQYSYDNIDPLVKDGTGLANDLNFWRNAVESSHSGPTRPAYVRAGMFWVKTGVTPNEYLYYDGADDILVGYIDTEANTFTVVSSYASSGIAEEVFTAGTGFIAGSSTTITVTNTYLS